MAHTDLGSSILRWGLLAHCSTQLTAEKPHVSEEILESNSMVSIFQQFAIRGRQKPLPYKVSLWGWQGGAHTDAGPVSRKGPNAGFLHSNVLQ